MFLGRCTDCFLEGMWGEGWELSRATGSGLLCDRNTDEQQSGMLGEEITKYPKREAKPDEDQIFLACAVWMQEFKCLPGFAFQKVLSVHF